MFRLALAVAFFLFVLSCGPFEMDLFSGRNALQRTLDTVGIYPGAVKLTEEFSAGTWDRGGSLAVYYSTPDDRQAVFRFYTERAAKTKGWHSRMSPLGALLLWKIETREVDQGDRKFKAPVTTESAAIEWGCRSSPDGCFKILMPHVERERITVTIGSQGFKTTLIGAPANSPVEVALSIDEQRPASHNFSVYRDEKGKKPVFIGGHTAYDTDLLFTTPFPGTYYFRCDLHPDTERGTIIVR